MRFRKIRRMPRCPAATAAWAAWAACTRTRKGWGAPPSLIGRSRRSFSGRRREKDEGGEHHAGARPLLLCSSGLPWVRGSATPGNSSPAAAAQPALYRKVKDSSMVTSTATGSPNRVPGRKRHCRAALIASSSSPKDPVERPDHADVADGSIRQDDRLDQDHTLNLRPHRLGRVAGGDLSQQARRFDAVAGSIDSTSGAAALAGPQAVSLAGPDSAAVSLAGAAVRPRSRPSRGRRTAAPRAVPSGSEARQPSAERRAVCSGIRAARAPVPARPGLPLPRAPRSARSCRPHRPPRPDAAAPATRSPHRPHRRPAPPAVSRRCRSWFGRLRRSLRRGRPG